MLIARRTALAGVFAFGFSCEGIAVGAAFGPTQATGHFFGSAASHSAIIETPCLATLLKAHCTVLTPEFSLKWDTLCPDGEQYRFGDADGLLAFAGTNQMEMRGHTLLWERSTPMWALKRIAQERDWRVVEQHLAKVMHRYPAILDWDVVNEPINGSSRGGLARNAFFRAFGPEYVSMALRTARRLRPDARMWLNDYGFSYDTPYHHNRRKALLRLLRTLRNNNIPIDGVGLQTHLDLAVGRLNQEVIVTFLEQLAELGLDIVITELDVKEANRSLPIDVRDFRVAREVSTFLEAALSVPAVKGVITWGLIDSHSWIQDDLPQGRNAPAHQLNRGLPFDSAYRPKPMFSAIQRALAR